MDADARALPWASRVRHVLDTAPAMDALRAVAPALLDVVAGYAAQTTVYIASEEDYCVGVYQWVVGGTECVAIQSAETNHPFGAETITALFVRPAAASAPMQLLAVTEGQLAMCSLTAAAPQQPAWSWAHASRGYRHCLSTHQTYCNDQASYAYDALRGVMYAVGGAYGQGDRMYPTLNLCRPPRVTLPLAVDDATAAAATAAAPKAGDDHGPNVVERPSIWHAVRERLTVPLRHALLVVHHRELLVLGGQDTFHDPLLLCGALRIDDPDALIAAPPPSAAAATAAAPANAQATADGTSNPPAADEHDRASFPPYASPSRQFWRDLPPLPETMIAYAQSAVVWRDRYLVIGGGSFGFSEFHCAVLDLHHLHPAAPPTPAQRAARPYPPPSDTLPPPPKTVVPLPDDDDADAPDLRDDQEYPPSPRTTARRRLQRDAITASAQYTGWQWFPPFAAIAGTCQLVCVPEDDDGLWAISGPDEFGLNFKRPNTSEYPTLPAGRPDRPVPTVKPAGLAARPKSDDARPAKPPRALCVERYNASAQRWEVVTDALRVSAASRAVSFAVTL